METLKSKILYISLDMERSGDWPDKHFVTEIGVVAFTENGKEIASLQLFLDKEPDKEWFPETLEWYKKNGQYERWEKEKRGAEDCMYDLRNWIYTTMKLVKASSHAFICMPTAVDGMWLNILWFRYLGHPAGHPSNGPGHTFIDVRSYGAGKLWVDIFQSKKSKALAKWCPDKDKYPHSHIAVEDAREQGMLFFNIENSRADAQ